MTVDCSDTTAKLKGSELLGKYEMVDTHPVPKVTGRAGLVQLGLTWVNRLYRDTNSMLQLKTVLSWFSFRHKRARLVHYSL